MKHSICFIDDKIPVSQYEYFNDTDIINGSVLSFLLKKRRNGLERYRCKGNVQKVTLRTR